MRPRVAIILLNWNGWRDTLECLESLYQISYPNYLVLVVDNDSSDQSLEQIRDYCKGKISVESEFFENDPSSKPIQLYEYSREEAEKAVINDADDIRNGDSKNKLILIKNHENQGFSAGNNLGIKFAMQIFDQDYTLLLNNDTVVDRKFLNHLIEAAAERPEAGVLGPKFYLYDFYGRKDVIWSVGGTINLSHYPGYHNIKDGDDLPTHLMDVDWISGAALLMKTREIPFKFLNEEFFFGCEDVDLCIRLREKGYQIVTVLSSVLWHKASVSKSKIRVRGQLREIKTNLKFLKMHSKNYYWLLPLYIFQMFVWFGSLLIKRIYRDFSAFLGKKIVNR
ncbi:MAG: glycosyltransferase family 2 protein [Methanobacteriaceae archaeon]|nr:glycosyltransferase family 2 protein [Methanobacteriaceae archaeon]